MSEETTPFLPGHASASATSTPSLVENTAPKTETPQFIASREYFTRPLKLLTLCSLLSAILSACVLLAAYISMELAPFQYYSYTSRVYMASLGGIMFCAFVISLINMRFRAFPVGLNIIADFFIAVFAFNVVPNVFDYAWPYSAWCSSSNGGCRGWIAAVRVLVGVGIGFGIVVGLDHVVMFFLRGIAIFKSGFFSPQRGLASRGFTPGEVTFQFTIKVLKQQDAVPARVAGDDAPSGSGAA